MNEVRQKALEFKDVILGMISVADGVLPSQAEKLKELGWQAYVHVGVESDVMRSEDAIGKGFPKIIVHDLKRFADDAIWNIDQNGDINLALAEVTEGLELDEISEQLIEAFENFYKTTKATTGTQTKKSVLDVVDRKKEGGKADLKVTTSAGSSEDFEYGVVKKFRARQTGNMPSHVYYSRQEWFFALQYVDPEREEKTREVREAYLDQIRKDQKMLLEKTFDDEWGPRDLIRHLRVRAGRTIQESISVCGFNDGTYIRFESGAPGSRSFAKAARLINSQFFRLPEDSDGVIDQEFATQFLEKIGFGNFNFVQNHGTVKAAIFKIISEAFNEYKMPSSKLKYNELPTINDCLFYLLEDYQGKGIRARPLTRKFLAALKKDKYESLKELMDEEFKGHKLSDQEIELLELLPVIRHNHDGPVPQPFNKDLQFFVAHKEAKTVGEFLDIFRKIAGLMFKEVGKTMGVSKQRAEQIIKRTERFRDLSKITGDKNPFCLPTGDDGKVHPDIIEHLARLNERPHTEKGVRGKSKADSFSR